ncbi:zinc uptake transcriptional repressor Zur [Motilimonas cestriensis]|uniref:Ferric uptake regulation protein n=1 Tax=Motilimonas cestriensis TaxID=2742685 RepID=A0ABS8W9X3_9GAMM|nr:zinc uptake transcriptional repressor Zur [Motilimonas cestriensis]MCE2595097.1 zinc uptake transcriptional repressor Zur [Motilimonas cestriensis]
MHNTSTELLKRAELICQKRSVRFTPIRQKVFSIMAEQLGSISAYDLLDKLRETEKSAKPPTIYRALDFLLEHGFIHKIESINAYILCPHFGTHHPMQLLICDQCGVVIELHDEKIDDAFSEQATSHGFSITNTTLEAHGNCSDCQSNEIA